MFNLEISRNINRILVTLCPVYVMYVKREVTRKYAGGWGCNVERAPPPIGSSHFAYSKEEQWWPEKCLSAYIWSSCWTGSWLPPELLESAWHFCDSSFAGQTSFSAAGCCPVQRGRLLCLSLQILEEWSMDASDGSQKIEILYLCGKASASLHLQLLWLPKYLISWAERSCIDHALELKCITEAVSVRKILSV